LRSRGRRRRRRTAPEGESDRVTSSGHTYRPLRSSLGWCAFEEKKQAPNRSGRAASHESLCRWDALSKVPHPEPKFIPAKPPSYMAGMESARRSPVTPSPGSSRTGPPNPSPPSPHLYRDMGMVMMPMKGRGPNYYADQRARPREAEDPPPGGRSRTAGGRPPTTDPLPATSIRQEACPSMCD
jgi:hypothetical protein